MSPFALFTHPLFLGILKALWTWMPLWLPVFLGAVLWKLWKIYTFSYFMDSQKFVLLEIKIPREVQKTPLAMELVLSTMHQTSGETNFIDRYWSGKRRTWFSLEIISVEGEIHFYIWTRAFFKDIVEAALYGQYPDIEVNEVSDYAYGVEFDPERNAIWGCEYKLNQPDAYPIKTYIDYGLEKPVPLKEQQSIVDPITPMLEFMGNVKKGSQIWLQILVQSHKKETSTGNSWFEKTDWKDEAHEIIDGILQRDPKTKAPKAAVKGGESVFTLLPVLSEGEQMKVKAIERSINKLAFNVGIRSLYVAEKESFNPVYIVGGMLSILKQFNSPELNGFSPTRWHYSFDWPWQDYRNFLANRYSRRLIEYYKRRAYFHSPYKQKPLVLTTEELATIFHIPSEVATTPALRRILSKRSEAPWNLPL